MILDNAGHKYTPNEHRELLCRNDLIAGHRKFAVCGQGISDDLHEFPWLVHRHKYIHIPLVSTPAESKVDVEYNM